MTSGEQERSDYKNPSFPQKETNQGLDHGRVIMVNKLYNYCSTFSESHKTESVFLVLIKVFESWCDFFQLFLR